MKFRKKPVVIEAVQYTGVAAGERILAWTAGTATSAFLADKVPSDGPTFDMEMTLRVRTLESGGGSHIVGPGDWVIRGVSGEHYPCKPDIFEATYEPAETHSTTSVNITAVASDGTAVGLHILPTFFITR